MQNRAKLRIGIPRVLNLYSTAPLFYRIFRIAGIKAKASFFLEYTSDSSTRWLQAGPIDPASRPNSEYRTSTTAEVAHTKKPLDVIFFP